jgi:hypothetical protein
MAHEVGRGALASWDRRVIRFGEAWARHARNYPCYTILRSTIVAFVILKGTKNFHMSLPRFIQREALQIGTWTAQLAFFGTFVLLLVTWAYE